MGLATGAIRGTESGVAVAGESHTDGGVRVCLLCYETSTALVTPLTMAGLTERGRAPLAPTRHALTLGEARTLAAFDSRVTCRMACTMRRCGA